MDTMTMDQLANLAKSKHTTPTDLMKEREARMRDLSVPDVAEQLNLHPSTVYALLRSGHFPGAYHTGRGGRTSPWRIPQTAVEQYRASRAA